MFYQAGQAFDEAHNGAVQCNSDAANIKIGIPRISLSQVGWG